MPDFATPAGASSLAHAQLAAAVHEPTHNPLAALSAAVSFARRAMARFITITTTVDPFEVQPDLWCDHVGRYAITLDCSEATSCPHMDTYD